jgi:hypothetical protein
MMVLKVTIIIYTVLSYLLLVFTNIDKSPSIQTVIEEGHTEDIILSIVVSIVIVYNIF